MEPAFTATGTRAVADLPHAHRCGIRWAGVNTAHCGSCCHTFVGITAFDRHRIGGMCTDPATLGMVRAIGRAYQAWTMTVPDPAPCGLDHVLTAGQLPLVPPMAAGCELTRGVSE